MPSRSSKIVTAALAASAFASSFLPSTGFMTPPASTFHLRRKGVHHAIVPAAAADESDHKGMMAPPPLGVTPTWWPEVHAYLVSTYDDHRDMNDVLKAMTTTPEPSEADMRKFSIDPKATFAEATYRYSEAKADTRAVLERTHPHVLRLWKLAMEKYYDFLRHVHEKQPIPAIVHLNIMAQLSLSSREVLAALGASESAPTSIHPQQWLILQERFRNIFNVDQSRRPQPMPLRSYGQRFAHQWNMRSPGWESSLMEDPAFNEIRTRFNEIAEALIAGERLSPATIIEHDYLMTKIVFYGERWLNDQKDSKIPRFEARFDYDSKKSPGADHQSALRFETQEYTASRNSPPVKSNSVLTFDYERESKSIETR